jgi:glycerol kinase
LGAAYLAGLAVGFWKKSEISESWQLNQTFEPNMEDFERDTLYKGWQKAVKRTMGWENE